MAVATAPNKSLDTSSFKGKYLFVNYDHDLKTAPHRNAVFGHVQRQYAQWKKREDARLLRESAKVPIIDAVKKKKPGAHAPLPTDKRSTNNSSSDNAEVELELVQQYAYGPVTVLKEGQSDPFNTFAIPIDSKVNHLMTYCREVELPSVHRDGTNPKGLYTLEEWATIIGLFEEPYSAYAHLTRVASAMPVTLDKKSDIAVTTLTFRGKVVTLLQEKMAEKDAMQNHRVFGAIAAMLHAEMYNSNFTGALFHAKMLAHMLQSGAVTVNARRTFDAFYYDHQRAVMSFARPCFDYEVWIPQHFAPMWTAVEAKLPPSTSYAAAIEKMDKTINDKRLRQLFMKLRHLNQVFLLAFVDVKIQVLTALEHPYQRSHCVHIMGQALNHYLDNFTFVNECRVQNILVGETVTHARAQAVLSLALLYWTRVVSKTDSFVIGGHKKIFVANAALLKRFRETYADYETFTLTETAKTYSRSMLWALHIGAWSEQMLGTEEDRDRNQRWWFGSRLANHADEMGLQSWQGVREVLLGFIHFDSLPPNGSQWFQKVRQDAELPEPAEVIED